MTDEPVPTITAESQARERLQRANARMLSSSNATGPAAEAEYIKAIAEVAEAESLWHSIRGTKP